MTDEIQIEETPQKVTAVSPLNLASEDLALALTQGSGVELRTNRRDQPPCGSDEIS